MKQAKRISLLLLFALWLAAPAAIPLVAQNINKTVTLSLKKASVKDFFTEMKKQTGLYLQFRASEKPACRDR